MKINQNKRTLIFSSIVIGSLLISTPSLALSLDIKNFFSTIVDDAKSSIKQLESKAKAQIDSTWNGIKSDATAAVDSAMGVMGAVDPVASSEDLKQRLRGSRSLPSAKAMGQELERQLTKSSVSALMSKEGQDETAKKMVQTVEIAQSAKTLGEQAQSMDASQNILKVIAAQNVQIVSAISRFHADSVTARIDTAQSNLMLTQVAESLSNSATKEELKTTGQVSLTQELVLMSVLDPARRNND